MSDGGRVQAVEADAGRDGRPELARFRRVRVELPDCHGVLRGKVVSAKKALSPRGLNFCDAFFGLSVDDDFFDNRFSDSATGYEDFVAVADPSTARPVPWQPDTGAVLADLKTKEGLPHPLCQREAVRRAERRIGALGFTAMVALEFEIFVARAEPGAVARRSYRDLLPLSHLQQAYSFQRWHHFAEFADQLQEDLAEYGAAIEAIHTELGYGALEASLEPAGPLDAADAAARFKQGCKEIAAQHGLVPTFMAKWSEDEPGSSGHLHQSLWSDGAPAFWGGFPDELSPLASAYLEGVLEATGDLAAVYGPFVNSYRRPGRRYWAPTAADWGTDDRLTCCRVVASHPESCRIEQRRPGADVAIYLAVAGCIGSGARGIERGLELRREARKAEQREADAEPLPASLREATDRLRASEVARDVLSPELVEHFVAGREVELEVEAREGARVPDWELSRYFETV